jgi:hypothetical protein
MSFRSFISTGLGTKIQVKIKIHIKMFLLLVHFNNQFETFPLEHKDHHL